MLEAPTVRQDWQSSRPETVGNICRMRIIIDKSLSNYFNKNKYRMRDYVKYFEKHLNYYYNEAGVSIRVNNQRLPFKFKVVDLQFHDEDYCRRQGNSPGRSSQQCDI